LDADGQAFYWFQLGHVRFATGDVNGAVTALETALRIDPGDPGATEKLAGIYAAIGRTDDAERLYAELLAAGPAADLHGSYADLLRARGADAEADRHEQLGMDLALSTIDSFPAERRHLVGFLLTRDADLAVELALADLAERQDPGAYDTAAWALYHAGRIAEARPLIEQALASGIQDAEIEAHAGFIAAAAGDDAAARRHLGRALDINDRFDATDAPAARALLTDLS
ncbi:MAG: tetratricopeptide repeat protein, partial [Ilumatobacter sp.]|nr:tetratricopeptide repeat protein [Ilumatobacter sp.]